MKAYIETVGLHNERLNKVVKLGIIIFTIGTFTLDTFISSFLVEAVFICLTIFVFILYYLIQNKGLIIYVPELMWFIFFIYFLFNILYHGKIYKIFYIDILVFFTLFILLLLVKIDIGYYRIAMKIMLVAAIIYALSSLLYYLY